MRQPRHTRARQTAEARHSRPVRGRKILVSLKFAGRLMNGSGLDSMVRQPTREVNRRSRITKRHRQPQEAFCLLLALTNNRHSPVTGLHRRKLLGLDERSNFRLAGHRGAIGRKAFPAIERSLLRDRGFPSNWVAAFCITPHPCGRAKPAAEPPITQAGPVALEQTESVIFCWASWARVFNGEPRLGE